MENSLIKGWIHSTIDFCFGEIINGTTTTQNESEGIPVSRIETVQNNKFDLKRIKFIQNPNETLIEKFQYQIGDIALSHINSMEHVGKVAIYDGNPKILLHGMNLLRLRAATNHVLPKFAYYYFLTGKFKEEVKSRVGQAVNQVSINQKNLKEIPFPLCPISEQHRIVAKLDAIMQKVEANKQRLEKIPKLLKCFKQSVLAAAVSGQLTKLWREENKIVNDWEEVVLNSLCDENRGISYGVIKLGENVSDGIPCLRTSDVKSLFIDTNSVKRISKSISDNYKRTILQGNEILINVRGTLGGVANVPKSLIGWNVSREIAIAPLKSNINSDFISFQIASTGSQNWLNDVAKGVAYTGINLEDLRNLPLKIPRDEEQKEIVRRLEHLLSFADKIEIRYNKAKAMLDKLPQSILAKAFRGELVVQDPGDEGAGVLVERIKVEKAERRKGGKGKKKEI
ncbi:MAG: restriction endonuclease subunit S [Saprospiraceae bacterium]